MTIFPEHFDQDLLLEQVTVANEITLTFHATSPTAPCPECGTISMRIQSRYRRTIHDLPNRGRPVHLVETVAAWFQHHPGIELISRDRASEEEENASNGHAASSSHQRKTAHQIVTASPYPASLS